VFAEPITELALEVVFGACLAAVSGGEFEQTFPSERIISLSASERVEYGVADGDAAYRIETDVGLVVIQQIEGYCRVITGEGDPEKARERFKERLMAFGGYLPQGEGLQDTLNTTFGKIDIADGEYIAISFTASTAGFFASSFRMKQEGE